MATKQAQQLDSERTDHPPSCWSRPSLTTSPLPACQYRVVILRTGLTKGPPRPQITEYPAWYQVMATDRTADLREVQLAGGPSVKGSQCSRNEPNFVCTEVHLASPSKFDPVQTSFHNPLCIPTKLSLGPGQCLFERWIWIPLQRWFHMNMILSVAFTCWVFTLVSVQRHKNLPPIPFPRHSAI